MAENPYATPKPGVPAPGPKQQPKRVLLKVFFGLAILAVAVALLLPLRRDIRPTVDQIDCQTNLKQISYALNDYINHYGTLPPAHTVDENGKPLHSWRTLILRYLKHEDLYRSIDLSKPWNDPANSVAFEAIPAVYQCPATELPPNYTSYLGCVGEDACFHPTRPRAVSEFTDGRSQTLMVIEMPREKAVHWMSPQDANEDAILNLGSHATLAHTDGFNGVYADGSVSYFIGSISKEILRALITAAGDDRLGDNAF